MRTKGERERRGPLTRGPAVLVEAGALRFLRPRPPGQEGEPPAKMVRLQDLQSTVDAMVKQALATSGKPSGSPTIVVALPMGQPLPGGSGSRRGPGPTAGGLGTSAAIGIGQASSVQAEASARGGLEAAS